MTDTEKKIRAQLRTLKKLQAELVSITKRLDLITQEIAKVQP